MNSAQRLEQIFRQLRDQQPPVPPGQEPAGIDAWVAIFNRSGISGYELEDAAQECAMAVREELGHLNRQLSDSAVPEILYIHHISNLRDITTVRFFPAQWRSLAASVKEENLTMLQWAGHYLGNAQDDEVQEAVERLVNEVEELLTRMESANLPPALHSFLQRNLRSVQNGLWRHKVSGFRPLREALQTVRGTGEQQREEIRAAAENLTEPERSIWKRAASTFNSAAETCDKATKLDGGYTLASGAVKALISLWP